MDKEVSIRLAKTGASFGRLWTRVWNEKAIKLRTKLAVYKTLVKDIHKSVRNFEDHCLQDLNQKRQTRKDKNMNPVTAFACP